MKPSAVLLKYTVAVLSLPVFVCLANGQTSPAPAAAPASAQENERTTFVSSANEVTIDLVVHDKKNEPILDLKPEDIAVSDSGTPVKVNSLHLVRAESAEHLITMVFDRLEPSSAKNAHDIAGKILKMLPNDFSVSVMGIGSRLRLMQGFTTDRTALAKAISAATEQAGEGSTDPAAEQETNLIAAVQTGVDSSGTKVSTQARNLDRVILASIEESQKIVQDQHCLSSMAGLLALARTQHRITGRKVVIYFEHAKDMDSNAKDMLLSVASAANRSGVSFYAIDANAVDEDASQGLLAAMAIGGVMSATRMAGPGANPAITHTTTPQAPAGSITAGADSLNRLETEGMSGYQSPMARLAATTGGAYITATDHLKKPVQQMLDDMTSYYEASYVPPVQGYDGKFRPVAVKPERKGIKIHANAGYFAVPPENGTDIRPFEGPLLKLLSASSTADDIKFQAAVMRLGDLPTGNENALVVELPISELDTRDDPNSNLYSLHASIVAQIKNKAGDVIEHFSEDVPRHGSLDSKTSPESALITMQRHFTADPGQYTVEAAVLDRNNEKAGVQRLDFEIPEEPAGPALSDVSLVERVIPMPQELDAAEPLRYGNGKVVPSVSGRVPHGAKQISFFFVVHPDPTSTEQPTLEMEVLKSNESIAQVPLHLTKTNGPASIPYLASIQAGSLSGGDYAVVERLTQSGHTVERRVSFRIEGPELASATPPEETGAAKAQDDAIAASASGLSASDVDGHRLVVTTLPAGTVPPPSEQELDTMVESARKRALDYSKSLPNFICVEVTNRSVDQAGTGNWKHRDSIAEMLTYHDGQESRKTLEVNGKKSTLTRAEMNSTWPMSIGEFGGLLNLVFAPTSKTHFEWKEAGSLGDGSGTLQVLGYKVVAEDATLELNEGNNNTIGVGFHGLVYLDAATGGVRRITVEADNLPRTFSMHGAAMTVEYDFVSISGRDYLLPVRSTVSLQRHKRQVELNEISFRGYRRFASRAKIKMIQ